VLGHTCHRRTLITPVAATPGTTDGAQIRALEITLRRVTKPPWRLEEDLGTARTSAEPDESASILTPAGILVLSVALDFGWKRVQAGKLSG
jgi:hypothetical protein